MRRKRNFIKSFKNIFFLMVLISCSRELNFEKASFGSDINNDGEILKSSTTYVFKEYQKEGSLQDFFNYVYFEGEPLCFSFEFSKKIPASYVEVWFYDKKSNRRFAAERVEVAGNIVWGFSLVGSVMENIYKGRQNKSIKTFSLPLKVDLDVELIYECNEINIKKRFPLSFEINI